MYCYYTNENMVVYFSSSYLFLFLAVFFLSMASFYTISYLSVVMSSMHLYDMLNDDDVIHVKDAGYCFIRLPLVTYDGRFHCLVGIRQ